MQADIVDLDRPERAGADVQRDECERHAARLQRVQRLLIEMQAGGRGCDGAGVPRVNRLIARRVILTSGARDVRRQRHLAVPFQPIEQRRIEVEAQMEQPLVARDHGGDRAAERDRRSRLRHVARFQLHPRSVVGNHALDQRLDASAGALLAVQARADHPRVVEDHQIAGGDVRWQIGE